MKKSNSFLNNSNYINKDDTKFESMKKVLHFPANQIKSNILLSCFTTDKFLKYQNKPKKSEYTLILNQKKKELNNISRISSNHSFMYYNNKLNAKEKKLKKDLSSKRNKGHSNSTNNIKVTDSDWSSYNYNNKVGLNAPLSFQELSRDSSETDKISKSMKNMNNNDNGYDYKIDYNNIKINNSKNNEPKIFKNNNIKNNSYTKLNKIKTNYNISNIFFKKQNNNNNQIKNKNYKNNIIINKDINNYSHNNTIFNTSYIIKKNNKNNNEVKIRNKNNIFRNLLLSLNTNKTANNIKKRNISYNNLNSSKLDKNNNIKNKNIFVSQKKNNNINKNLKLEESNVSSDDSSILDFSNINSPTSTKKNNLINNNFLLTKNFIANKNNHFNIKQEKTAPSSRRKNRSTTPNFSKSRLNSGSGRTKDKTNRTINQQKNIIINIKQNFQTCKTPVLSSRLNKKNKKKKSKKNKNINKTIDKGKGYNYRNYIELIEFKEKKNPGERIYIRELLLKQKNEEKLEEMRKMKNYEEMMEVQQIPKINDISRKITKNNLPIYKRLGDIEMKRKLNAEKIKNLIIKEKEINENTINDKCAKNNFHKKNFNKWLLSNENWKIQKNLKMEKMKNLINQEKIESEKFIFKPKIDKNSEKIFNSNNNSKYPVVERLYKAKEEKDSLIKKKEDEELLSFRPEINKDYQIRNQYYEFMEEDQAEIYNELKEKIENEEKKL